MPADIEHIPLTRDEQVRAQQAFNHQLTTGMTKVMAMPRWKTWPTATRAEAIHEVISDARASARAEIARAVGAPEFRRRALAATPAGR